MDKIIKDLNDKLIILNKRKGLSFFLIVFSTLIAHGMGKLLGDYPFFSLIGFLLALMKLIVFFIILYLLTLLLLKMKVLKK